MGWFGKSKVGKALAGGAKALAQDGGMNKEFLEASCAAAAIMAGAEGGVSPEEKLQAVKAVSQNPTLGEVYDLGQIEACMTRMIGRVETSTGRHALEGELRDIIKLEKGLEMARYVCFIAYDVMMADGNASDKEKARFEKVCKLFQLDPKEFYEA